MTQQLVLGLDLASEKTGVVLLDLATREIHERDTITARGSWKAARRVAFIADALREWIVEPAVVDIWAEDLATHYVTSAFAMGRIHQAVALVVAEHSPLDRRIDEAFGLLDTSAIKMHATGKPGSKKPAMIAAAIARWPALVEATDDEADAAWVADLGAVRLKAAIDDARQ